MMRSLYSGISGLKNHQTRMDVIGNNIANVNTIGFKTSRVVFQDIYSQTLRAGSAGITPADDGTGGMGGTNPAQIGLGVKLGSIDVIHTSAPTQRTDNPLDLAIDGDGYFIVRNPQTGTDYYSRAGNFRLDDKGNLVTSDGFFVMGYNATNAGVAVQLTNGKGDTLWADEAKSTPLYVNLSTLTTEQLNAIKYSNAAVALEAFKSAGVTLTAAATGAATNNATAVSAAQTAATTALTAANALVAGLNSARDAEIAAKVDAKVKAADAKVAIAAANADPTDTALATAATAAIAASDAAAVAYDVAAAAYLVASEGYNKANAAATAAQKVADAVAAVVAADPAAPVEDIIDAATKVLDAYEKEVAAAEKLDADNEKTVVDAISAAIKSSISDGTYAGPKINENAIPPVTVESIAQDIVNTLKSGELRTQEVESSIDNVLAPINLDGYVSIAVDFDGTIYGIKDDIRTPIAMLGIALFANPSGLEKSGSSLYRKSGASGEPIETTPQQNGAGLINGGGLEMSNVDLAAEFTDMIVTQRGYQANSRIITVSDSMLEELVNLKR